MFFNTKAKEESEKSSSQPELLSQNVSRKRSLSEPSLPMALEEKKEESMKPGLPSTPAKPIANFGVRAKTSSSPKEKMLYSYERPENKEFKLDGQSPHPFFQERYTPPHLLTPLKVTIVRSSLPRKKT